MFTDAVIRPLAWMTSSLSIYRGAKWSADGTPFSFVPCQPLPSAGSARLALSPRGALAGRITPTLRQGQKVSAATSADIKSAWAEVVSQVNQADLQLAVRLNEPQRR